MITFKTKADRQKSAFKICNHFYDQYNLTTQRELVFTAYSSYQSARHADIHKGDLYSILQARLTSILVNNNYLQKCHQKIYRIVNPLNTFEDVEIISFDRTKSEDFASCIKIASDAFYFMEDPRQKNNSRLWAMFSQVYNDWLNRDKSSENNIVNTRATRYKTREEMFSTDLVFSSVMELEAYCKKLSTLGYEPGQVEHYKNLMKQKLF
jgi:hypothetical protein